MKQGTVPRFDETGDGSSVQTDMIIRALSIRGCSLLPRAVLVAIAIPIFTKQLEKSRDATSASNIRAAYAEAQASYLAEAASDSSVTINKDANNKITSIDVSGVAFKGVQPGWSGTITDLPKNVDWSALGADADGALGGSAGAKTLKFTYGTDNAGNDTITLSVQ